MYQLLTSCQKWKRIIAKEFLKQFELIFEEKLQICVEGSKHQYLISENPTQSKISYVISIPPSNEVWASKYCQIWASKYWQTNYFYEIEEVINYLKQNEELEPI